MSRDLNISHDRNPKTKTRLDLTSFRLSVLPDFLHKGNNHSKGNLKTIQPHQSVPLEHNLVIGRNHFQLLCIRNCMKCGSSSILSECKPNVADLNMSAAENPTSPMVLCDTCQVQATFLTKYISRKMFQFQQAYTTKGDARRNSSWTIEWIGKNENIAFINECVMKRFEKYPIHTYKPPPSDITPITNTSFKGEYTIIQLCDPHLSQQDEKLSVVAEYIVMECQNTDVMDLTDSPDHVTSDERELDTSAPSSLIDNIHKQQEMDLSFVIKGITTPTDIQRNAFFFLHKGFNMTSLRIKKLTDILEENMGNTIMVQSTFHPDRLPQYLVVDPDLSKEVLCETLGFRDMKHMIVSLRDVFIVIPNFILAFRNLDKPPPISYCHVLMTEIRKMNHALQLASLSCNDPNISVDHRKRPRSNWMTSDSDMSTRTTTTTPSSSLSSTSIGRNREISQLLEKISLVYKESPMDKHDVWRSYMYKICSTRILHLDFEIKFDDPDSMKRLKQLKGFGSSIQQTIREYLLLNRCKRLDDLESDEKRIGMRNLTRIWGVGPSKALEWVNIGYRTIQDIREAVAVDELMISQNQKIGIRYYEDFLEKMPRHETREIGKKVTEAVKCLFPDAEVMIMGSYRRGAMQNGDVDVLITLPNYKYGDHAIPNGALDELVDRLMEEGHISNHLTKVDPQYRQRMPSQNDDFIDDYLPRFEQQTYMGVFHSPQVPGKMRRIDIKFYPYRDKAFAMLYFTGNGYFNRAMRLYAKRAKDMKLKDCGLFIMSLGREVKRIECATEQDIFKALDLEYCEPRTRDGLDAVRVKGDTATSLEEKIGSLNQIHPTEEDILHDSQHPWIE